MYKIREEDSMRLIMAICGLMTAISTAAEPAPVRQLSVSVKLEAKGKPTTPTIVTSSEELEKAIVDEASRKEVAKLVDFKKEKLAIFAWAGSGQDKITFDTKEGKKVAFTYAPGRTRDLRQHVAIFVYPADHSVEIK